MGPYEFDSQYHSAGFIDMSHITKSTYEMGNFASTIDEGSQLSPDNTHADNGCIKGSAPKDYEVPSSNNTELEEPDNEVTLIGIE